MASRHSIDPFDVEWIESDPLDRDVIMLRSVHEAREGLGKHAGPPEYLSTDDVRVVVSDPDRIDESVRSESRNIYYKSDTEQEYPYSRAVVDFRGDSRRGVVISWSRYLHPVASYGVLWKKGE